MKKNIKITLCLIFMFLSITFLINFIYAEIIVFSDGATNPETNGHWTVLRGNIPGCYAYSNSASTGKWDDTTKVYQLTNAHDQEITLYSKYNITSNNWRVEYDFLEIYSNADYAPDTIGFAFFSDSRNCNTSSPLYNGNGYQVAVDYYANAWDPGSSDSSCSLGGHPVLCPYLELIKTIDNHLASAKSVGLRDEKWHHLSIIFNNGNIKAKIDKGLDICNNGIDDDGDGLKDCADPDCTNYTFCGGANNGSSSIYSIDKNIPISSESYGKIGFQIRAQTGADYGYLYFKNFTLYCTPKTCSDYPDKCGSFGDECGGKLECTCSEGKVCNPTTKLCEVIQTCPDNQTIMRLRSLTNSLGALWDYSSYNYRVCYNDIFGSDWTSENPHACSGKNKIIGLSSSSGANAEIPSFYNYHSDVCYGDLICHNETSSGDGCTDSSEKVVVNLEKSTDSKISSTNNANFSIKICCKHQPSLPPGDGYWADMDGNKINKAPLGCTVKLIVNKPEVQNKEINYKIYKQAQVSWNPLDWFSSKAAQFSDFGFTTWKANEGGIFYFIGKILNTGEEVNTHGKAFGDLEIGGVDNSKPSIRIVKPVNESSYIIRPSQTTTNIINFEQISSNRCDDLKINWTFGDRTGTELNNCLTNGNCNTTHQYSSSGTKMVTAIAKEMTRNQKAIDYSRIYVYKEGLNIFAIIDSPNYKFPLKEAGIFKIDGTSSHVANCSYSLSRCQTSSSNCYEEVDSIDPSLKIYCYKIATSDQLNFRWEIDGVLQNVTNSVPFYKVFVKSEGHNINLRVSYSY